jgi:hypothetical protein
MVQKTPLTGARYWTLKITCSKYYAMNVLRLYDMEIKCLLVNTSYSSTEVFTRLNTQKYVIEEYLQYKYMYSLAYTILTVTTMASQGL